MRFWSDDSPTEYYKLVCLLSASESGMPEQKECYGICDEDAGGYIAFTTSQEHAELITHALNGRPYNKAGGPFNDPSCS